MCKWLSRMASHAMSDWKAYQQKQQTGMQKLTCIP
jgi:hypothetical protein